MPLKTPQVFFERIKKILYSYRVVILSSLLFGCAAHMYMMMNKLPNHDDITYLNGYGAGYSSGRWFLALMGDTVGKVIGNYSLPWFNGLLTILLIAAAACVFVNLFRIDDALGRVLASGIMVVFPTVTCLMCFMFTSYYYGVAILLVLISCRLILTRRYGFLVGALGIACAVGAYQAFFILAAGILLLYLIVQCMDDAVSVRELLMLSLKCLAALMLSLGFYLVLNKLFLALNQTSLTDYQAISQMGNLSLRDILKGIKTTYYTFFYMLHKDYLGITNTPFIRALLIGTIAVDFLAGVIWILQRHSIVKKILFCVLALLFPMAVNGIHILCPRISYIYALMFYSLALVWLLPLVLSEALLRSTSGTMRWKCVCSWLVTLTLGLSILYFSRYANTVYLSMNMTYQQTASYYTTLVTRIKSVPGYREDMKVAYLGNVQDKTIYEGKKLFDEITLTLGSGELIGNYSWAAFVKKYLGFHPKTVKDTSKLSNMDEVKRMPAYPADGSIQVIDDVVVVKFS